MAGIPDDVPDGPPNHAEILHGLIEQARGLQRKEGIMMLEVDFLKKQIAERTKRRDGFYQDAKRFEDAIYEVQDEIRKVRRGGDSHAEALKLAKLDGKIEALTPFFDGSFNTVSRLNEKLTADYHAMENLQKNISLVQKEREDLITIINEGFDGFPDVLMFDVHDVVYMLRYCRFQYTLSMPFSAELKTRLLSECTLNGVTVTD